MERQRSVTETFLDFNTEEMPVKNKEITFFSLIPQTDTLLVVLICTVSLALLFFINWMFMKMKNDLKNKRKYVENIEALRRINYEHC